LGGAALKAGKVQFLRSRQSDPVRYLKNAGIILIHTHQHISVHHAKIITKGEF
jgi:hypothetical protein